MYEDLIKALLDCRVCFHDCACCGNNQEICCGSTDDLIDATADAIELLTGQLAALQAENGSKDKEIERLEREKSAAWEYQEQMVDALAAMDSQALSRVEEERDALLEYAETQMECEMCKNDVFCPVANPMPENCAVCELKPKCPCHPCKWEWRGAQGEG